MLAWPSQPLRFCDFHPDAQAPVDGVGCLSIKRSDHEVSSETQAKGSVAKTGKDLEKQDLRAARWGWAAPAGRARVRRSTLHGVQPYLYLDE